MAALIDVKKPVMSAPLRNSTGSGSRAPPGPPPVHVNNGMPSTGGLRSQGSTPRSLDLKGHVGFDTLPQQLVQKATTQGFVFNILCVGETGIGKSTLMESLFNMPMEFEPCSYELKTVELRSKTYDVEESNVRLKLTIVETAGFGDQLDKDNSAKLILEFINKQFEMYLQEELKIKRNLQLYKDSRIHVCLYFISPTGHGLKALDVVTMRELSQRVNIIPVIAKADTTSKDELKRFKAKILSELKSNGIELYKFPTDDETVREQNEQLNASVPFAVVGSTDFVKKNGKQVRARNYPWGIVEVENEEHCDFVKLRESLLRINVEDLRERTHARLYERYRRARLADMGLKDGEAGPGFARAFDERFKTHKEEMQRKEKEAKDKFVKRVQEKEKELKNQDDMMKAAFTEKKKRYDDELEETAAQLRAVEQEMTALEQRRIQQATQTIGRKKK